MQEADMGSAGEPEIARDLVHRIRSGDSKAETELVQRYSRGLLFLLRRMTRDPALADDLHQETFRIVLQRLRSGGIREPDKLAGFVHATARHLFVGDYRKRMRRRTEATGDHDSELADPTPSPLTQVLRTEESRIVRQLISELDTDRDRQLLFRFYVAEHDKEAICADLGLTGLHFNRVLYRARQRFKQLLERTAGLMEVK
jgi:RNA polymerase sigma-70 factor (ECF subfamily)